jgi:hypothetical protein
MLIKNLLARTFFGIQNPRFYQFYRTLPLPENSSTRPKIRRESLTR